MSKVSCSGLQAAGLRKHHFYRPNLYSFAAPMYSQGDRTICTCSYRQSIIDKVTESANCKVS
jgi:hypothetical protein